MGNIGTSSDLVRLTRKVERALLAHLEPVLAAHELSADEWLVLCASGESDGVTMSEIATQTGLPAPTLTKIVDRMVVNNLVHRRIDQRDRRRVRIRLTPRGKSVHRKVTAFVEHADTALALDEAARALTGLLETLAQEDASRINSS